MDIVDQGFLKAKKAKIKNLHILKKIIKEMIKQHIETLSRKDHQTS
jgi:hypothetical protein